MTRNINNLELKTSNYFINFIQSNPYKKTKLKQKSLDITSEFNKLHKNETPRTLLTSHPSKRLKLVKKISQKKEGKNSKNILSPDSKIKIGYLKQFNNNSIYYSNHKNDSRNKTQNLNTEIKHVILNNKSNLSKNLKLINLKKKNNSSLNNNKKEDSKNSTINYNVKKISKLILLNKNNCSIIKFKKININKNDINKKGFQVIPKKKLLNIISAKNIFDEEPKYNLNTSRVKKSTNRSVKKYNIVPKIIIPEEYIKINKIGHGTFGKIFKVKWNKNNKKYAMKEMKFQSIDNIIYLKERVKTIVDFQKKTKCNGVIKTYGDCSVKKNDQYFYYEIMELAEKDWEKEIKKRNQNLNYYTENELINIMTQLIKTLSLLQQNHITHRDIKLQNILIINNKYKICDFGESRTLNQKGIIVQPVRGSELFMSPILFFGLQEKAITVTHNTYKSDVFSLGMCILFAATLNENSLYEIREMTNMDSIKNVLEYYLCKRYSIVFIEILLYMLEINEKKRPDFIQLERFISQCSITN